MNCRAGELADKEDIRAGADLEPNDINDGIRFAVAVLVIHLVVDACIGDSDLWLTDGGGTEDLPTELGDELLVSAATKNGEPTPEPELLDVLIVSTADIISASMFGRHDTGNEAPDWPVNARLPAGDPDSVCNTVETTGRNGSIVIFPSLTLTAIEC